MRIIRWTVTFLIVTAAVVLGVPSPASAADSLTVTPHIDFGNVDVNGGVGRATITVKNDLNTRVHDIDFTNLWDQQPSDVFQTTWGTCIDFRALEPGQSCTMRLSFDPDRTGYFSSSVGADFTIWWGSYLHNPYIGVHPQNIYISVTGTGVVTTTPTPTPTPDPAPAPSPNPPASEPIYGTPGNDTIRGTAGPDIIYGMGGDDVLIGLEGNDLLIGGPGKDKCKGGPGTDRAKCEKKKSIP